MGESWRSAERRLAEVWAEASTELPTLRHGRVSLARIMAASPGAFCALRLCGDGSARCEYVSEHVAGVCHESEEAFTRAPLACVDERDLERVRASIAQAVHGTTAFRCEYRVKSQDEVWIEAHLVPVPDDEGDLVWCGSLRDATERKQLERQITLKSDALENSLNAFAMLTRDGRFLYANRTYLRMWGFDVLEELIGTRPYDHCVDPSIPGRITRALSQGDSITLEFTARRRDGSTFETLMSVQRVENRAGLEHYMGTAIDITERKRAEEAQLRSQKLEALGTLAGGIAHDFNNMLLAVLGNAALVSEGLAPDHPAQSLLAQITTAGERAAELVKHILTFSRPQDQKRSTLALGPVVHEALKLVRATLPARVEIRTHFAEDTPLVLSDRTQLHQIVINLATNAAHAIGERPGVIELALDGVLLSEDPSAAQTGLREGRYARLCVRDDGMGMDRMTLERIFDPFFTTKPVGKGTGLGLSVVHGIMRSSGGAIRVESKPGKGACFKLYFPAVGGKAERGSVDAIATPRGRGEHVLVIDDEPALVSLAEQALGALGYRVTGFHSPVAALERFCNDPNSFDAVLSDMSMPKLSGIDVLRAVRAVRPSLPMILVSGHLRPEEQAAAQELGVHELLHKPTSYHTIGRVLHRLLSMQAASP